MSINTISRLNHIQMQGSADKTEAAEDGQEAAIAKQQKYIKETRDFRMKEINERAEARESEGLGRLLGTIIGGPIIGTLIGGAIGGAVGDSSTEASNEAKRHAETSSLLYDKASDDFKKASDKFDDARTHSDEVEKFSTELRDFAWTDTVR